MEVEDLQIKSNREKNGEALPKEAPLKVEVTRIPRGDDNFRRSIHAKYFLDLASRPHHIINILA